MTSEAFFGVPSISIKVDRGQLSYTFYFKEGWIHGRAPAFMKYLEESGNGRNEGPYKFYELPNERREIFELVLQVLGTREIPDHLPGLRVSRLSTLIEVYSAANRLRMDEVMNIILDVFLTDLKSDESLFPWTLVSDIYKKTEKDSGLRRWFIEQVTMSLDPEDLQGFGEYWPHEALVDLATFCLERSVPPLNMVDMTKFYQPSFDTRDDEDGE